MRTATRPSAPDSKLRLGRVDDPAEREADRMAEAVVSTPSYPIAASLRAGRSSGVLQRCACDDEDETLRRFPGSPAGAVSPATASRIAALRGGGTPLSPAQRAYFEPHFGDLSAVRLHTGTNAAAAAREVSARAFAVGRDIAFGAGQYRPESLAGRRLLAHELTHTVQQGGGVIRRESAERAAAGELHSRVRGLTDEQLVAVLDELYLRAGAAGRGRTGAGTAEEPFENYALQLRRHLRTDAGSAGLLGAGTVAGGGLPGSESLLPADPVALLGTGPGLLESREDFAARVLPELEREARQRLPGAPGSAELFIPGAPGSWSRTTSSGDLAAAVEQVRGRLATIAAPTASGHLRSAGRGFVYTAARDHAADHQAFLARGDEVLGLTSARDRRRWEIFRFLMRTEGDTSAVNAYDDQIVTLGAGYSLRSGLGQRVYERLPAVYRRRLFEHGIEIGQGGTFAALDLSTGTVAEGNAAAEVLRADERRLSLLIRLAQSEESMSDGTDSAPAREWMLRAQYQQLESRVPADVLDSWPLGTAKIAIKMNHWQPSVATWRELDRWSAGGTDPHAMASQARDAIWEFHGRPTGGDYGLAAIEHRFSRRARGARVGALRFRPRPAGTPTGPEPTTP